MSAATAATTTNGNGHDEVVDGTAVEVYHAPAPTNLFRTDDPAEVIIRATAVADALKTVLQRQGLTTNIQGREHVRVEGWTTLGSMLGVVPVVTWTRPIEMGWEARVEARTLDGRIIGAAEAGCSRSESKWKNSDDYAVRSMAQTRATSKALRGPLGFVVTLAGYEAAPAEEVPAGSPAGESSTETPTTPQRPSARPRARSDRPATVAQRGLLNGKAAEAGLTHGEFANVLLVAVGEPVRAWKDEATASRWLKRQLERLPARHVDAVLEGIKGAGETKAPAAKPKRGRRS